ncbi:MAG TPA: nuclear transport factor 2 family protein [Thermoanaerobaculia bacterium]|nr:nuclear transport factor 2 family protein [Thermoanaerobaculia bacterium]
MNRRALFLSFVLLLFTAPLIAQLTTARLQQVLDAWAALDPAKPGAFYAKDPGLVFYDVAPRAYKGWAEYEKGTRDVFKTMKSIAFKMHDASVHNVGNTAWASALVDTEVVDKDGKHDKIDARWTSIWEKRGNNWLIVHDHFSAPLPPPPPPPKPAAKKKP